MAGKSVHRVGWMVSPPMGFKAPFKLRFVLLLVLVVIGLGGCRDQPRAKAVGRVQYESITEFDLASEEFDPGQSAGLFVGINDFKNEPDLALNYAVDDAVDLAHLFSNGLGLVPPDKVTIAIAGEPNKEETVARLAALQAAGAQVIRDPSRNDILLAIQKRRDAAGRLGILFLSVSTHGFRDATGDDYIMAADSNRTDLQGSAVSVRLLLERLRESEAPRRVALMDACREQITKSIVPEEIPAAMVAEIQKSKGTAIVYGSAPGGVAFESKGNGMLSAMVLKGLGEASAATANEELITVAMLVGFVERQLESQIKEMPEQFRVRTYGINTDLDSQIRNMPLAVNAQARRARILSILQQHIGQQNGISGTTHDEVKEFFSWASAADAAPVIEKVQSYSILNAFPGDDFERFWREYSASFGGSASWWAAIWWIPLLLIVFVLMVLVVMNRRRGERQAQVVLSPPPSQPIVSPQPVARQVAPPSIQAPPPSPGVEVKPQPAPEPETPKAVPLQPIAAVSPRPAGGIWHTDPHRVALLLSGDEKDRLKVLKSIQEARQYREEWLRELGLPAAVSIGPDLVYTFVPPANYVFSKHKDQFIRDIVPGFYIGRQLLSRKAVMVFLEDVADSEDPAIVSMMQDPAFREFRSDAGAFDDPAPATRLSAGDAQLWGEWMARQTGLTLALATELQWDFALFCGVSGDGRVEPDIDALNHWQIRYTTNAEWTSSGFAAPAEKKYRDAAPSFDASLSIRAVPREGQGDRSPMSGQTRRVNLGVRHVIPATYENLKILMNPDRSAS